LSAMLAAGGMPLFYSPPALCPAQSHDAKRPDAGNLFR
jgi:hypothetical protein